MTIVTGVRSGRGDSRCIALVDDEQRREQARAAGADLVLVKGIPADSLLATVKEMLTEEAGLGNSHSPGGKGQSMNAEKHAARCADDDGSPIVNRL